MGDSRGRPGGPGRAPGASRGAPGRAPKIDRKNDPKMDEKWSQKGPQMDPKMAPKWYLSAISRYTKPNFWPPGCLLAPLNKIIEKTRCFLCFNQNHRENSLFFAFQPNMTRYC